MTQPTSSFPESVLAVNIPPCLPTNLPLNPQLYQALAAAFGKVGISHPGEQRSVRYAPNHANGSKFSAKPVKFGEQYQIDCPFCGDRRQRCHVSYMCGIYDPRSNNYGWSLFYCFNEKCQSRSENWRRLRTRLQEAGYQAGSLLPARDLLPFTTAPQPVPCRLPERLIPLHQLPDDHEALAYLIARRFNPLNISVRYGVCYCASNTTVEPTFENRLCIPIYQSRSNSIGAGPLLLSEFELVGWQARSLDDNSQPKYLSFAGFKKSQCLYGLSAALSTSGPVVLCEGVTDAWRLGPGSLALFGKTISRQQIRLINQHFAGRSIVILLDRDAWQDALEIRKALMNSRSSTEDKNRVFVASLPVGYDDPGDCPLKEVVPCLTKALRTTRQSWRPNSSFFVYGGQHGQLPHQAVQKIGKSVAVSYAASSSLPADAELSPTIGMAFVGDDCQPRYAARGAATLLALLDDQIFIYHDSLAARRLEIREGLPVPTRFEDLSIMAHLLDETAPYDLLSVSKQFHSINAPETPLVAPSPLAPEAGIALQEAALIRRIWDKRLLRSRITYRNLDFLYKEVELPAIESVATMMEHGVPFDAAWLINRRQECLQIAAAQEEKITALTNLKFDAAEDAAVRQFLAELNLPGAQYSKDNMPATNKEALQALVGKHPVIEPLIEARHEKYLAKEISRLLGHIDEKTGRIHCTLDPITCNTGRILCSKPNLQAMPGDLRNAVVADEGKSLVYADWSQFELRILTHFAQEPDFVEVYESGKGDIHRQTAGAIFGKQPDEVTDNERKVGKRINFSLVNGLTCHGLASDLQIPTDEAEAFIEKFFAQYPRIRTWIDKAIETATINGFTSSLYYRRRHLPDLRSQDRWQIEKANRQVVSGIIQATGADIFKLMLGRLYRELPPGCKIILPIHDAVLLEVNDNLVEETASLVRRMMQEMPPDFSIPLVADVHVGKRWGKLEEFKATEA
jgi:DNA polymerase I-like protein with 3'-5' exonuclease and polymerase domains